MRVRHLKMHSYRGLGDLEIDFDTVEPTVFIGINGSGKSSILDCIALLLSSFINRIAAGKDDASENIFSVRDLTIPEESSELRSELKNEITIAHSIAGARINDSESEDFTTFAGGLVLHEFGFYPRNDLGELNLITLRIRNQLRTNGKFNLPLVVLYPVSRSFNIQSLNENIARRDSEKPQLEAYENALSGDKVDFENFFHWFKYREDVENEKRIYENSSNRDPQLEAVRNAITELLPDFEELRIKRDPLRMVVSKRGTELNVEQLSDGEKCLLTMVGDLARRLAIANPGLSNCLEGQGIVLIDEIELHLHPQRQRGIIPSLTRVFPNCQFIITTHSPQVISDIKPNGIYILEASDKGIIAKHPEFSFGRDSNQILEDVMNVSERPISIKNDLRQLFRLIEDGSLTEAKSLQRHLENLIGDDEPEFAKADILIRRKEVLGR